VNRPVSQIRAELEHEREGLVQSAEALRTEVHRELDVRRWLREHPLARVAVIVGAVLVVLVVLAAAVGVVRTLASLFRRR
jgi:hypothetical protein